MKLTQEEFNSLRPINNKVVVKLDRLTNNRSKGGIILLDDRAADMLFHINVWGEVVKQCDNLIYKNRLENGKTAMPWDVPMETKVGDRVAFNYKAIYEALGKKVESLKDTESDQWFIIGDDEETIYAFLHYKDLILIKKEDDLIPLNGYCLCTDLIEEAVIKSKLIIPAHIRTKESTRYAKVEKIGVLVKEFEGEERFKDGDWVKAGDIICYDSWNNIAVEWVTDQKLDKKYFRIHRRSMSAIVPIELLNYIVPGTN
jgi:co-chaperonin GroES (HSP10)